MTRWLGAAAALVALGSARAARGQAGGWVDVDVAHVQTGRALSVAREFAVSIAPSIRRDWRRFSIAGDASATASDRQHFFVQNALAGTMRTSEHRGLVAEGGIGVSGLVYRTANTIRTIGGEHENVVPIASGLLQVDARARADLALGRWGFFFSGSAGENFGGNVHMPWGVEAGATRELRHLLVFASVRADRFRSTHELLTYDVVSDVQSTQLFTSTRPVDRTDPMLTLASGATIAFGRAELTAEAGGRQGTHDVGLTGTEVRSWTEMWGSAIASYRVTPSTLVRVAAGTYPTDFIRQLPNGSYASVGVRMERGRRQQVDWYQPPDLPAFRVDTIAGGARVIRIRAPRALKVELSGDFTDWTPLPMRALPGGAWELILPIAAGTYRVSVRVDGGAWTAPPGLVPVADEFNGEVAVVVIR
ncbi:MAG: glycogen-binding domain-containing protein [Gemmatimonadaceae bacterium]